MLCCPPGPARLPRVDMCPGNSWRSIWGCAPPVSPGDTWLQGIPGMFSGGRRLCHQFISPRPWEGGRAHVEQGTHSSCQGGLQAHPWAA